MRTISKFVMPDTNVRISKVSVDTKKLSFQLVLETKAKGARKWTKQIVNGTCRKALGEYFSLAKADKIQIAADNEKGFAWVPTGELITDFNKYLRKRGIEWKENILSELVFETHNHSADYAACPFKLIMLKGGKNILSLVNVAPMQRTVHVNQDTGEVTERYSEKYYQHSSGQYRKTFVAPKDYRRLIIQTDVEVAEYQPAEAAAQ